MPVVMSIEIPCDEVDFERHQAFAEALLAAADESGSELSLAFVTDEAIQKLNQQYRNTDKPTDVLSFSMREGESVGQNELLGDIVLSIETAVRQAQLMGHSLDDEIDELLFHGLVHLLGGDHFDEASRKKWFVMEETLIADLQQHNQTYTPKGLTVYETTLEMETGEIAPHSAAANQS